MSDKSKEQKLVDICFQCAIMVHMNPKGCFTGKTNEDIANWVSNQLRQCGFETHPIGMSWGVLISDDLKKQLLQNAS
jgi:hypothetical protein